MVSLFVKMTSFFGIRVGRVEHYPSVAKSELTLRSDIENLSLGVGNGGGEMYVLIPSDTKILKKEKLFTGSGSVDNQSDAYVGVYEGESLLVTENVLVGELFLEGTYPAPKDMYKFKVCFDIDVNGTLRVSVEDIISSELKKEITITSEERRSAKTLNARNTFQKYAEDIKKTLSDTSFAGKLKAAQKRKIKKAANKAIIWLNENQSAKVYEYKDKQKVLEDLWNPSITKLYKDAMPRKVENKSTSQKPESRSVTPKTTSQKPESRRTASQKPEFGSVTPKTAFNLSEVD